MTDAPRFRSEALNTDFEMIGEVGRGGTGVVYHARHRNTGRDVAVKVIRARYVEDAETITRFEREAKASSRLRHPHIVAVHGLRQLEDGGVAIVMQYVAGCTLKELIRDAGPLSYDVIERVLRDVGSALRHAHSVHIVHRDVKPENIFVESESGHAMLADFGIARSTEHESSLTLTGVAIGTPSYMSPEQIDGGELDGRSDIYSLGLVGWEMLSSRRPWEGENLYGVIYRQKHEDLEAPEQLRADVPPRIAHAITWSLMKEPRLRPSSVEAFLQQLERDTPMYVPRPPRRAMAPPAEAADTSRTMRFDRPPPASAAPSDAPRRSRTETPAAPLLFPPYDEPSEQRWWRSRAAVIGAVVALPVLLVLGAVARGAISGGAEEGDAEPIVSIVDQPVGVPMGPAVPPDTAPAALAAPPDTMAEDPGFESLSPALGERPVLRPRDEPVLPPSQPRLPPAPSDTEAAPAPIRTPPVARAETTAPAAQPIPLPQPAAAAGGSGRADEMTSVAAGGTHSCAISGTGVLYCWGGNDRGQLAAEGPRRSAPAASPTEQRFTTVVAGLGHACALNRNGEAFCWGGNGSGQLGNGSVASTTSPTRVAGARPFRAISAGVNHSCAVSRSGEAYCWGNNSDGQLGDGSTVNRTVPVRLAGGGQFVTIAAGRTHSCAVSTQQLLYCWGSNSGGQLGDGSTDSRPYPGPVAGNTRFSGVATGNAHSCGLTPAGEAFCWGENAAGQLGDGSTSPRTSPVRVSSELRFASLVAGSMHTCGVTRGGEAYCWGRNSYGQLGDGTTSDRSTPARVRGGHSFRSIHASGAHTCGVSGSGEALCWGYNVEGQLGDGSRSHRATPVPAGRPGS